MTLQPSQFQIDAIQFSKINFEKFLPVEETEVCLEQNISPAILTSSNKLLVILNSSLIVSDKKENRIFSFEIEIQGSFKVLGRPNKKIHRNLVSIVFSYIRPMIAQITSLSGLPPLNLPPLDLSKIDIYYPESKEK